MKRERLIILFGLLIALVFFYIGLNQWLRTKDEKVQPLPVVVEPTPRQEEIQKPIEDQKPMEKQNQPSEKDLIAQKIREEKAIEKQAPKQEEVQKTPPKTAERQVAKVEQKTQKEHAKEEMKNYTIQIGAFKNKEGAQKIAEKARNMKYKVNIIEEDNFYKVRIMVATRDINKELEKIRKTFGDAVLIR